MPKVIALDYGTKRTGVAMSDDRQIIASPLDTIPTSEIIAYLIQLVAKENTETIILGEAKRLNGQASEITLLQASFAKKLKNHFPAIEIIRINEMFTSSMAMQTLITGGFKKSERSKKENLDKISAAIILQSYLDQIKR